jgi:hypothetical protein
MPVLMKKRRKRVIFIIKIENLRHLNTKIKTLKELFK